MCAASVTACPQVAGCAPQQRQGDQQRGQQQPPARGRRLHPVQCIPRGRRQGLSSPESKQARMLLQRDLPQCLLDALQQLPVFVADEQVEVRGEAAVERLQAQAAIEMASNQGAQCGLQANRRVRQAGFDRLQCRIPVGQLLQPDLWMMCAQPTGVGPAFNHGDDPSVEFAHLPWQPFARAPGQQGRAAAKAAGRGKVGAGERLVSRPAKDHDQIGLVMAHREDRRGGGRIGPFQEAELGMPGHQAGVAMGQRWR